MSCKVKKVALILGIACCSTFMTSCEESAEKIISNAESYVVNGNDFKGALNYIDEVLVENPDNRELLKLKEEISNYLTAKELYYNDNFDEAVKYLDKEDALTEGTVMEEPYDSLYERIESQKESKKKKDSSSKLAYLKDAEKLSKEEADFSIEQAFVIFSPHEEKFEKQDEFNSLLAITERNEEQEARLSELKQDVLGATTISSNAYRDSKGIFRVGSQHYLFRNTGEQIIYKVYKDGNVEKV